MPLLICHHLPFQTRTSSSQFQDSPSTDTLQYHYQQKPATLLQKLTHLICENQTAHPSHINQMLWKKLYQTTVDIMQQLKHAPLHLSSVKACSQQIWMDELDHNQNYRTSYCHPPAYSLGNAGNIPNRQGCQMKETKLMAGNGCAEVPSIASERTK